MELGLVHIAAVALIGKMTLCTIESLWRKKSQTVLVRLYEPVPDLYFSYLCDLARSELKLCGLSAVIIWDPDRSMNRFTFGSHARTCLETTSVTFT